jgi:hypothetical protein
VLSAAAVLFDLPFTADIPIHLQNIAGLDLGPQDTTIA